jgi:hypothetical protein
MLLARCFGGAGFKVVHLLATALHRHTCIADHRHDIPAMPASKESLFHANPSFGIHYVLFRINNAPESGHHNSSTCKECERWNKANRI